jgi:hypothetical protein
MNYGRVREADRHLCRGDYNHGLGSLGAQVPYPRNDPMFIETACFFVASILLAVPLIRLWKLQENNLGAAMFGFAGVGVQELACLYGFFSLAWRMITISR